MSETIESLDNRITNIEAKLGVVMDSIVIMLRLFDNIETKHLELSNNSRYISENLVNNVAYLEDVGNGEVY